MSEVVLVRFPEEGADGARLAAEGVAVLYLVAGDDAPPTPTTCLEDWVRLPGDERDLSARVAALELRSAAHQAPPVVDEQGRLHYRGRLLALAPAEARLADALVGHFGEVVSDRELTAIAFTEGSADVQLRTQITKLRSRLREIGLSLHRIRRRGYKLQRR
jgi:DNA-binding response OmpR family regulator